MKKIITVAAITGAALTLAACGGETPEVPAEEPAAEATEAAPAEDGAMTEDDAAALDAAAAAAEGTETNGNPVGPAAPAGEGAGR